MKLQARNADKEYDLSLNLSEGVASVTIDERAYELEVRDTGSGVYLLVDGTELHRCRVEASQNTFSVAIGRTNYEVEITDPKRLRSGQTSGGHDHGAAEITSPMPGKVVRVLVEVGATVEAGASVLVVEAMKMQNELKAPKAGVVVSLNAQVGTTVNAGQVLAVIE